MAKVHKRASAKRDLIEHYVYLAENASLETAERFLANADENFADLSGTLPDHTMHRLIDAAPPALDALRQNR